VIALAQHTLGRREEGIIVLAACGGSSVSLCSDLTYDRSALARRARNRGDTMLGSGTRARCVVASLLLAATGCSFAMVRPTPQLVDGAAQPVCAPKAFPLIDLGAGVGMVALTAAIAPLGNLGAALCDPGPGQTCPQKSATSAYVFGYVTAGVLAASAVYGFAAGAKCEAAISRGAAVPPPGGAGRYDLLPPPPIEPPGTSSRSAGW